MRIFPTIALFLLVSLFITGCGKSRSFESKPPEKEIDRLTIPGDRPVPYEPGKKYQYAFTVEDKQIGLASFVINEYSGGYMISSDIELDDKDYGDIIRGSGSLILDSNWIPMSYTRSSYMEFGMEEDVKGDFSVRCEFADGKGTITFEDPQSAEKEEITIEHPDTFFLFDNNFIGQMAFMCSQPELKSGRRENLILLALQQKVLVAITFTPKIKVQMDFLGRKIVAYETDMKSNGQTFGRYFITPEGVLIRALEDGGRMSIDLITDYEAELETSSDEVS